MYIYIYYIYKYVSTCIMYVTPLFCYHIPRLQAHNTSMDHKWAPDITVYFCHTSNTFTEPESAQYKHSQYLFPVCTYITCSDM